MKSENLTVYFDVGHVDPGKVTGIGVYTIQLAKWLGKNRSVQLVPVVKPSRWKKTKALEEQLRQRVRVIWPWTGWRKKSAIYHGPDFKINAGPFLPRVVTIHDTVVLERRYNEPAFYKKGSQRLRRVLHSNPDAILVNSQFTKSEILKHFGNHLTKIFVTHLGCESSPAEPLPVIPPSFIFYLGTLETRKNVTSVVEAFNHLCGDGEVGEGGDHLVLVGGKGHGYNEVIKSIIASPYRDRIHYLGQLRTEHIQHLFKNAKAFIFPSWYEGFGLPILEAMRSGCPVITSRGGALEEVAGGAALLVDPANPLEIKEAMLKLSKEEGLRESLIKKARERAKSFTWEACARTTLKAYRYALERCTQRPASMRKAHRL